MMAPSPLEALGLERTYRLDGPIGGVNSHGLERGIVLYRITLLGERLGSGQHGSQALRGGCFEQNCYHTYSGLKTILCPAALDGREEQSNNTNIASETLDRAS